MRLWRNDSSIPRREPRCEDAVKPLPTLLISTVLGKPGIIAQRRGDGEQCVVSRLTVACQAVSASALLDRYIAADKKG